MGDLGAAFAACVLAVVGFFCRFCFCFFFAETTAERWPHSPFFTCFILPFSTVLTRAPCFRALLRLSSALAFVRGVRALGSSPLNLLERERVLENARFHERIECAECVCVCVCAIPRRALVVFARALSLPGVCVCVCVCE